MSAILITEPIAPSVVETILRKGYKVQTEYGTPNPDVTPDEIEAVIVRTRPIDRPWMDQYPNLKIIAYHGVGIDGIDLETARACGIRVTTTPGQNSLSVAEHALSLMLALAKQLVPVATDYKAKGFDCKYSHQYIELSGRTLGLLGMGNIGYRVAQMAHNGFGMRVLVYDPFLKEGKPGIELVSDRMEVFRQADFVSLHLPLLPSTQQSVGTAEFKAMKPSAFLINCARGAIVNQQELIQALQNGEIAGAGLDVTDPEHCEIGDPLLSLPNAIVTPHIAASSEESLVRVASMCLESIEAVLAGKEPQGAVV